MPPKSQKRKNANNRQETKIQKNLNPIDNAVDVVGKISNSLDMLHEPSKQITDNLTSTLAKLYEHTKSNESTFFKNDRALPSLMTDGFDSETIWQQLILHTDPLLSKIQKRVVHYTQLAEESEKKMAEQEEKQEEIDIFMASLEKPEELMDDEDEDMMDMDDEDMFDMDEDIFGDLPGEDEDMDMEDQEEIASFYSGLEDGFFDWNEMERFADIGDDEGNTELLDEDNKARRRLRIKHGELEEDDEEIEDDEHDLGDAIEGEFKAKYEDFFLPPEKSKIYKAKMAKMANKKTAAVATKKATTSASTSKNVKFSGKDDVELIPNRRSLKTMMDADTDEEEEESEVEEEKSSSSTLINEDDDEDASDHLLSSYQKKERVMLRQIEAIEQQLVSPKAWDQTGEVRAHMRPQDDLLTKHLDIEFATRVAQPITEEASQEIEQIILQRCRDNVFDDVRKRIAPVELPYTSKEELSTEKSKFGLAEIYEQEYLQAAVDAPTENDEKTSLMHTAIKAEFGKLCHQLDALTNFHFTPKVPVPEINVVSSTPAIAMEEILPMGVSDADRMAPQEVFQSSTSGLLVSKSEQSQAERNASRQARKEKKKKHHTVLDETRKEAAAAGDTRAAKIIQQKEYSAAYTKAVHTNLVTHVKGTDSTRWATSTQAFQKIQEQQQRDHSGIRQPKKEARTDKRSVGSFKS